MSLLIGCIADGPAEPNLKEHDGQKTIILNRQVLNGIIANRVAATTVANSPLVVGGVGGSSFVANPASDQLLSTPEGRDYYSYIVSCAMPAGTTVEATIDGTRHAFPGAVGLAPAWAYRSLAEKERRWVSACLLARVNAYGISVSISMRGDHEALTVGPEEAANYPVVEGAFYGNVFVGTESIEAAACRGQDQAAGEFGGLVNRDCTEPGEDGNTLCGIHYAGDCQNYTPAEPSAYACSFEANGLYEKCHTNAAAGTWPAASLRREVITVYVADQE